MKAEGSGPGCWTGRSDRLWSRGAARVWLKTDPVSRAAGFYRRSGWRETGTLEHGEITFELEYRIQTAFD